RKLAIERECRVRIEAQRRMERRFGDSLGQFGSAIQGQSLQVSGWGSLSLFQRLRVSDALRSQLVCFAHSTWPSQKTIFAPRLWRAPVPMNLNWLNWSAGYGCICGGAMIRVRLPSFTSGPISCESPTAIMSLGTLIFAAGTSRLRVQGLE